MTSSSSSPAVVRDLDAATVRTPPLGADLRSGAWTRLGDDGVLGDRPTESVLHGLAESARAAAHAQGYATGWAEGRRAAEQQAQAEAENAATQRAAERARWAGEQERALGALRAAARLLESTVTQVCAAVEAQAVDVALQLTEAVLGREIALAEQPAADAVRRALTLVPEGTTVTVRLRPEDRSALDPAEFAAYGVRLVDDSGLAEGDAIVETDTAVVDATIAAAPARVREVLAP